MTQFRRALHEGAIRVLTGSYSHRDGASRGAVAAAEQRGGHGRVTAGAELRRREGLGLGVIQRRPVNARQRRVASERERSIHVCLHDCEDVTHAPLAARGNRPYPRTTDHHDRPERDQLDDIEPRTDAAVDQHLELAPNRVDHVRERAHSRRHRIELAATVTETTTPSTPTSAARRASSRSSTPLTSRRPSQ